MLSSPTMAKGTFDLKAWALVGAQQRLRELDQERAAIFSAFPQLRGSTPGRRRGRPRKVQADGVTAAATGVKKRKRPKMTAAQKKAVSLRMKKYWAERKKAAKTTK